MVRPPGSQLLLRRQAQIEMVVRKGIKQAARLMRVAEAVQERE